MVEAPLAARMRPRSFEEFAGQGQLVGAGKVLSTLVESGHLPSIVLWGPAGTGKTTLAHLLAAAAGGELTQLSAVSSGVADARKVMEAACGGPGLFRTVLFVDEVHRWTWDEFRALPSETITVDISCVTKWTKLDTIWEGVPVDALLEGVETSAEYLTAFCDGGYTTNLPLTDVTGGRAWIAFAYDGEPLEPEHGGPARLLVPHLYFWKSPKWVRGLRLTATDEPGFWETNGYHIYGDPWKEQRYWGD